MLVLDNWRRNANTVFMASLGGTRHTHAAIERRYKRLPRVLSGLTFVFEINDCRERLTLVNGSRRQMA